MNVSFHMIYRLRGLCHNHRTNFWFFNSTPIRFDQHVLTFTQKGRMPGPMTRSLFLTGGGFDATPIHVDKLKAALSYYPRTPVSKTPLIQFPDKLVVFSQTSWLVLATLTNCPVNIMCSGKKVKQVLICMSRDPVNRP